MVAQDLDVEQRIWGLAGQHGRRLNVGRWRSLARRGRLQGFDTGRQQDLQPRRRRLPLRQERFAVRRLRGQPFVVGPSLIETSRPFGQRRFGGCGRRRLGRRRRQRRQARQALRHRDERTGCGQCDGEPHGDADGAGDEVCNQGHRQSQAGAKADRRTPPPAAARPGGRCHACAHERAGGPLPRGASPAAAVASEFGCGDRVTISGPSTACITSDTGSSFSSSVVIARRYLRMWRKNFL